MGRRTGIIKFNVKDRARRYRGVDRNFDTVKLASIINGGDVQERVKCRDMQGYFGHWPRVRFGMNPTEGGILDGKVVALEPAIVSTYIKADPDGNIEHEAEFLDTSAGRLAEKLFLSKTGGFSSAIDAKKLGGQQVPFGFYGFDYVLEPNFSKNRGYSAILDGVTDEQMLAVLDDVADYRGMLDAVSGLYDSLQTAYDLQAAAMRRLAEENEQLMSMLSKGETGKREIVLDGIAAEAFGGGESRFSRADDFLRSELPAYQEPQEEKRDDPVSGLLGRMFRG